eukprot:scaffold5037_cov114-Isochrysis_galbana.AAC.6
MASESSFILAAGVAAGTISSTSIVMGPERFRLVMPIRRSELLLIMMGAHEEDVLNDHREEGGRLARRRDGDAVANVVRPDDVGEEEGVEHVGRDAPCEHRNRQQCRAERQQPVDDGDGPDGKQDD